MKDKFNRIVATGMIALLISNFAACDEVDTTIKPNESISGAVQSQSDENALKGSIWDAIKDSKYANYSTFASEDKSSLDYSAIPTTFLCEQGLTYYDDQGKLQINGKQPDDTYSPLSSACFVDENTNENDVYLLVQYASGVPGIAEDDVNVDLVTWKLKYTLDDDNYQTFLKLDGDFMARFFIQEMDKQFEPEIVSHSNINRRTMMSGSYVRGKDEKSLFPNIYVSNIDFDNCSLMYAVRTINGYCFYDFDIRQTKAWDNCMNKYDITIDQMYEYVDMITKETLLGPCLNKFEIDSNEIILSLNIANRLLNSSTLIHELKECDINSEQNKNLLER